jgi:salicylate hydroxylase
MHPNAAQGYSQIVEDIGMLHALLSQAPKDASVAQITKVWQDLRKPRVDRIKSFAKWNTKAFNGESNTLNKSTHANSTISLKSVTPNMNAEFYTSAFLKWALDYDAVGVVCRPITWGVFYTDLF